MLMKRINLKYLSVLVIIFLIGLIALSCHNPTIPSPSSNNDVINYKDFFLSAEKVNLNTLTRGTIFVRGDIKKPEAVRILISAWVEIDTADWGGVSFNIPQGWEVNSIISDYPQGNSKPENYIATLQTESPNEQYQRIIEIGCTRHGAAEPQGGEGNVLIELAPKSSELPENFETIIGVGSENDYILNPVHDTIQVPLNIDYHTSIGS
jgi:hypothetical protein